MFLSPLLLIHRSYVSLCVFIDCFAEHRKMGDIMVTELQKLDAVSQAGTYNHAEAYVDHFLRVLLYSLQVSTQCRLQ